MSTNPFAVYKTPHPFLCECCWEVLQKDIPATKCMEWDEWLCDEHAEQALKDRDEEKL